MFFLKPSELEFLVDGLRSGISRYMRFHTRLALLLKYPSLPERQVVDSERLLSGHEDALRAHFVDRDPVQSISQGQKISGRMSPLEELSLPGMVVAGYRFGGDGYQYWFAEHHPDMCSPGPMLRWIERGASILTSEILTRRARFAPDPQSTLAAVSADMFQSGSTLLALESYARIAIIDFLNLELKRLMGAQQFGLDQFRLVGEFVRAVPRISTTLEEGARAKGHLVLEFADHSEPSPLVVRFAEKHAPDLDDAKHIRKLLTTLPTPEHSLVTNGRRILGIMHGTPRGFHLTAHFMGRVGELTLGHPDTIVCTFSDGLYYGASVSPGRAFLESALRAARLQAMPSPALLDIVAFITREVITRRHGCMIVLDPRRAVGDLTGQHLEDPLDLSSPALREIAIAMARVDGALHLVDEGHLSAFACLLDGKTTGTEDCARGARYNSALRFTREHPETSVVVVSEDGLASVFAHGVEVSPSREAECASSDRVPVRLEAWLKTSG